MHNKNNIASEKPNPPKRRAPSRDSQKIEFKKFYANHENIRDYCIALVSDGYNRFTFTSSADSLRRDILTINTRMDSEGIGFVTSVLPSLFQSLLDYLEDGVSHYPGFRKVPGREYPAFMQKFFAAIYDVKTCETDKAMYIDVLYTICVAFKKLKGPYRERVLRKQLADFVETDIELRYLDLTSDPEIRVIGELAQRTIHDVVKNLNIVDDTRKFVPRPGPGATNTNVEKHLRFRPHVLYTQLNEQFPYEEWFYTHPWALVTESYKHPFRLPVEEVPTSRFKFVPKTFSKPRGICIEQLETQFLQQAVKKGLYECIENHPITMGKVNFASQRINGELALQSSLTKELATIDMSEASDRVARKLVSRLFRDNVDFKDKLMALSTRIIELPDEINFIKEFPSAKFAPMGSALCFPIMAIVHFALIRAICQFIGRPEHLDSIYVYGDDILCHRDIVEAVYTYLPKFGMKLNQQKSYYKSFFRESCGIHAYYGKDITPVYFKSTPNTNMDVSSYVSCLQIEGQLYKKGFYETARLLRTELRTMNTYGFELPYVPLMSPVPGFIRESKTLLQLADLKTKRRRWDSDTQSWSVRVIVLKALQEQLPMITQDEGYMRWLTTGAEMEDAGSLLPVNLNLRTTHQAHVRGSLLRLKTKAVWLRESALNAGLKEDKWNFHGCAPKGGKTLLTRVLYHLENHMEWIM